MTAIDWEHYEIPLGTNRPRAVFLPRVRGPTLRRLAEPSDWLGAWLVDAVLFLASAVAILAVGESSRTDQTAALHLGLIALLAAGGICQLVLLSKRGQTIGKMLFRVRIVRFDDEGNPGFGRAVVSRCLVPALLVRIPWFGQLFLLADLLSIFSDERRCIHDLIAGTKVVEC